MLVFFFFFQAEDGIRDYKVTGVQTCALPISIRSIREHAIRHALTLGKQSRRIANLLSELVNNDRKSASGTACNRCSQFERAQPRFHHGSAVVASCRDCIDSAHFIRGTRPPPVSRQPDRSLTTMTCVQGYS